MVPSASKCITWNVVFAAEIVAIVTVNLLSIILFYKDQKPSHSQYVLGYKLNRGGHVGWRTFWSF